jgi:hypothetical protein
LFSTPPSTLCVLTIWTNRLAIPGHTNNIVDLLPHPPEAGDELFFRAAGAISFENGCIVRPHPPMAPRLLIKRCSREFDFRVEF